MHSGGWIRTNDLRVMSGTGSFFTFSCHSAIYDFSVFRAGHFSGQHVEHVQHVERKFSYILATFQVAVQVLNSSLDNEDLIGDFPCAIRTETTFSCQNYSSLTR